MKKQKKEIITREAHEDEYLTAGLIAEDVCEKIPVDFVRSIIAFDPKNKIVGFKSGALIAGLIAAVQDLNRRLKEAGI